MEQSGNDNAQDIEAAKQRKISGWPIYSPSSQNSLPSLVNMKFFQTLGTFVTLSHGYAFQGVALLISEISHSIGSYKQASAMNVHSRLIMLFNDKNYCCFLN